MVDVEMQAYLRDNQCLDGSLGRAVEIVANSFSSDQSLITIGYFLVIGNCVATVAIYLLSQNSINQKIFKNENEKVE